MFFSLPAIPPRYGQKEAPLMSCDDMPESDETAAEDEIDFLEAYIEEHGAAGIAIEPPDRIVLSVPKP
jgi:hypothetical protein